ncbi:glutathione binding-like protein [Hydromonas duriensis]|uniref:Glutathione S-transferase n=1 Tax=Hydromonas duriensis TaxID=1527608 RepID=A0A4R6Y6V1_9BURK|nr:glutathione binding-like protein [Hydromonas duriensis]TDR31142.1 glutathione S-transferase [Hydromonas duriensis]
MKLYFYAGACSLVPHIVARELNLDVTALAAPRPDDAGRAEYLDKVNPLGAVPALQLDDNRVLTQNLAIVEYLAAQGQAGIVYPQLGTFEHAQALRWLSFANSDLHPAFKPLFAPQRFTTDEASFDSVKDLAKDRVLDLYAYLNTEYQGKDWIAGNQYSAADVYIYVTYRWATRMGLDVSPFANLRAMADRIQARPAVVKALAEQNQPAI